MLSFASRLSPDNEAFAVFVSEKYEFKDKKNVLSNEIVEKINSFLKLLKTKNKLRKKTC